MTNFEINKQPQEVERKFLADLALLEGSPDDYEHASIRQGYLVIGEDSSEARVRDKAGKYSITVKTKGDLVRGEWETELSEDQFETLWPATEGKRVEKTRFKIPHGEYTIELDIYEGDLEGLVSAEIEFESVHAAQQFEAPAWLGKDVTDNSGYKNQNLARNGVPHE